MVPELRWSVGVTGITVQTHRFEIEKLQVIENCFWSRIKTVLTETITEVHARRSKDAKESFTRLLTVERGGEVDPLAEVKFTHWSKV